MATYISDDPKLLDELFRKDGEGQLLVGYETGKEKPHAESSYMLYPANPDRQDPVYTFMALFSQQSIKAKYSAFVPNTRLEIYSFPKMTDVPAISGDISKKEYINQVLLPLYPGKGTGSSNKYQSEKCPVCAVTQRYPHDIGRTSETDHTAVGRAGPFSSEAG